MADIGTEVGQKMRSAIKAKLMELDCYVDDELPDYIMVMVANKRTKSQMNTDLQLFLTSKTSVFVDWLHIVLKKLKEVHVTNPDVYKKVTKRKVEELPDVKVKREKKDKKPIKKELEKSLTDDLPISANKLTEMRKIVVVQEKTHDDSFDIPLLSEVADESELEAINKQIKSVKNRLGITVQSESEDEDFLNIKTDPEELLGHEKSRKSSNENKTNARKITVEEPTTERSFTPELPEEPSQTSVENANDSSSNKTEKRHTRITFDRNYNEPTPRKSVLERLGKRPDQSDFYSPKKRSRSDNSDITADEEIMGMRRNLLKSLKRRQQDLKDDRRKNQNNNRRKDQNDARRTLEKKRDVLGRRLEVMSKIEIPKKDKIQQPEVIEEVEDIRPNKEVQSMVKVKPRILPPGTKQANKNLLLKAVADAQRSIASTPKVGSNQKPDALYTKNYKEKQDGDKRSSGKRTLSDKEKNKLKSLLEDNKKESGSLENEDENMTLDDSEFIKQQFIVTLDGLDKEKYAKFTNKIQDRIGKRQTPSPIVFEAASSAIKLKHDVPDILPVVEPPLAVKNKEKCKYWPNCRQGTKCEFVHPNTTCKTFPLCKFGDKCLFIHPTCKFETSCTRRDCPYSHSTGVNSKTTAPRVAPVVPTKTTLQICKYYPQCSNLHCTFYHPRPCKFGKFCKNQTECTFTHSFPNKSNLTWRPDHKV